MIKHIYTFFIGVLLATFIGVGVAAFYEAPRQPDYPIGETTPEIMKQLEVNNRDYWNSTKIYARNVSIITLIFSVSILVVSLTLLSKLQLISDGLLLGGLFTELYSIARGFESQDNKFRFVVVTAGLITSLTIGYLKFIKNNQVVRRKV